MKTELLSKVKTIVTHKNCADGVASAYLCVQVLNVGDVRFVQYGAPEHANLGPEEGMLFVDMSPPYELAQEFAEKGALVLDHHKTATEEIKRFFDEDHAVMMEAPGVSGATLAFEHVYDKLVAEETGGSNRDALEWLARLVAVRDTWCKDSEDWEEACKVSSVLTWYPTYKVLDMPPQDLVECVKDIGDTLWDKKQGRTEQAVKGCFFDEAFSFTENRMVKLAFVQGVTNSSDTAEALEKRGTNVDIVVGFDAYVEGGTLITQYSLRSHTGVDVSKIAFFNGGGGHAAAAGFKAVATMMHPISQFITSHLTKKEV